MKNFFGCLKRVVTTHPFSMKMKKWKSVWWWRFSVKSTIYFPARSEFKISLHDSELILFSFIDVLDTTLISCGHAVTQAPHKLQKSRLVTDFPSTISTALHGHTSWHAWQESPLQTFSSASFSANSNVPSNGLVIVIASLGHISEHQEQLTQVSLTMNVSPVTGGTTSSSLYIHPEQTCLIASSGQTLLQTPQKIHLDKSTSIVLFMTSLLAVGTFLTVIAPAGHKSAQNEK